MESTTLFKYETAGGDRIVYSNKTLDLRHCRLSVGPWTLRFSRDLARIQDSVVRLKVKCLSLKRWSVIKGDKRTAADNAAKKQKKNGEIKKDILRQGK